MVSPRTAKRNAVDQLNNLAAVLGPSKPADDSDTFHFNNLFQGDRMFDTENVGTIAHLFFHFLHFHVDVRQMAHCQHYHLVHLATSLIFVWMK